MGECANTKTVFLACCFTGHSTHTPGTRPDSSRWITVSVSSQTQTSCSSCDFPSGITSTALKHDRPRCWIETKPAFVLLPRQLILFLTHLLKLAGPTSNWVKGAFLWNTRGSLLGFALSPFNIKTNHGCLDWGTAQNTAQEMTAAAVGKSYENFSSHQEKSSLQGIRGCAGRNLNLVRRIITVMSDHCMFHPSCSIRLSWEWGLFGK